VKGSEGTRLVASFILTISGDLAFRSFDLNSKGERDEDN
jgi:hypothetical protein